MGVQQRRNHREPWEQNLMQRVIFGLWARSNNTCTKNYHTP